MKLFRSLSRITTMTLRGLVLAGAFAGAADFAAAQVPSGAARTQPGLPKRIFTKTAEFKLPIQMDDRTRASLDRVCLYVKCGDAPWLRQDAGPATLPYFLYRVPQDGEYWFSLTTIDKSGRMSPSDVSQEPPSLRVMVDTKAPMLDLQPWASPQGEICLRCRVIDANPDPASLKVTAKLAGGDRPLAPYPGQPGVFQAFGSDMLTAPMLVSASDLAGNQTTREVRLCDLMAHSVQAAKQQPAPMNPTTAQVELPPASKVELPAPPPLPLIPLSEATPVTLPPAPSAPWAANNPPMGAVPTMPPSIPAPAAVANPAAAPISNSTPATVATTATTTVVHSAPPMPTNMRPDLDAPPRSSPGAAAGISKQIINTPRASLDYRVDQVGPSGVGKVEVYMTTDDGQTWQRIADDVDRRSPVEFDLPGEGLFGVRLAVTNGNGFGGRPPQRGDRPICWIEVDASAPFVQLRPIEPVVVNGALDIRWQATDKNLNSDPVNLYYRSRSDGPWQVIARAVKNDGNYRWTFPRDAAAQFFVKVEVTDQAGNIARVETPNPIVLDTTEPQATVIGVSAMNTRPGGN